LAGSVCGEICSEGTGETGGAIPGLAIRVGDCRCGDVAVACYQCEPWEAGEAFSCGLVIFVAEGVDLEACSFGSDVVAIAAFAADVIGEELLTVLV
jgi:hypothetical protein